MRILALLLLAFFLGGDARLAMAFTGTFGINYGRIADNIPSPDKVVTLLKAAKIKNVRIYDADHSVLNAFKGTGLELVIGLPNGFLKEMSANPDHALTWVEDNVKAFLPDTRIVGIAVGNEVLGGDGEFSQALLGAVKNIYNATKMLGIDRVVQISTAHSQAVFQNSFPPSSCTFTEAVAPLMKPLLEFFSHIGSPFCLNAYPFLAYTYNKGKIDIKYALFQPNKGIVDNKTDLHYDNLLDAQIDAAYAALEDAGFKKMEVIITETGWASHGGEDEAAATPSNARTYHFNLRKRLAKRKGTPLRPKHVLKAYIFALFNEDSKPNALSEKYYGLFKADGSISYDLGLPGLKSSSASSPFFSSKEVGGGKWCWLLLTISASTLILLLRL
ncbi:glucan endo-1,3-beta-glucosidase 11-like [Salvia splendens]|uniref:glucan endo-1,3-beta-glucosidase 11-like n=1 Tax=Salvia splendens TaxID=180675 RepID=UPI001C25BAEA|nr:glucan endo-1,3-beta-glucosidase 11-like [Salvia splendens]